MKSGKRSTACQVTLQCQLKLFKTALNFILLPPVAAAGTKALRDLLGGLYLPNFVPRGSVCCEAATEQKPFCKANDNNEQNLPIKE